MNNIDQPYADTLLSLTFLNVDSLKPLRRIWRFSAKSTVSSPPTWPEAQQNAFEDIDMFYKRK